MADPAVSPGPAPIGGQYTVDLARPLPGAGGGIPAWAVRGGRRDGAHPAMALAVSPHAPLRARAIQSLTQSIEGLCMPLAQGLGPPIDGRPGWFLVCDAPLGLPLSASAHPWPEHVLIERVLRPIAEVLDALQHRGLTHRAIRPDNVFQPAPNAPVVLGVAWAAPPAMHQPAVYETAQSALCHPAGRGDGRIADDVYALGVLLLTLALGHVPLLAQHPDATPAEIAFRKLDMGDAAALIGGERLPPQLGDLIRGMLADDPDHRPPPALLRDPAAARGRRLGARPHARAGRPLHLGPHPVWNTKTLAFAIAVNPAEAATAILTGTAMFWLRRALGDTALAVKLEELARQHALAAPAEKDAAGATLTLRAAVAADPLMPVCWPGATFFPDGLGTLLAQPPERDPELARKLRDAVLAEATGVWAGMREERVPAGPPRLEARQYRVVVQIKGLAGGLPRLMYTLNPLLPCASPLLADTLIARPDDLPAALDALVSKAGGPESPIDAHIAAFLGARTERGLEQEVKALGESAESAAELLAVTRLLSGLQIRYHRAPLPGLTAWVAARAGPLIARWRNKERRAAREARLKALVPEGFLRPILALLEDDAGQAADAEGLREARRELAEIDTALRAIADGGPHRAMLAARLGQEVAAGLGLAAAAATLIAAALG